MQPQTRNAAGICTLIASSSVQEKQGIMGTPMIPGFVPVRGSEFEFGYGDSQEFGVESGTEGTRDANILRSV